MLSENVVREQLAALASVQTGTTQFKPLLVTSVLAVTSLREVRAAMARISPEYNPDDRTLRTILKNLRKKMGLPELPTNPKGGRPSESINDEYRAKHCTSWIEKNGGTPRYEQLADPFWDFKPSLPQCDSTSLPTASKSPVSNVEDSAKETKDKTRKLNKSAMHDVRPPAKQNPISHAIKLEGELEGLTIDSDYPSKCWDLKTEIHKLYQNGQKPSYTERQQWIKAIEKKMNSAEIIWDKDNFVESKKPLA